MIYHCPNFPASLGKLIFSSTSTRIRHFWHIPPSSPGLSLARTPKMSPKMYWNCCSSPSWSLPEARSDPENLQNWPSSPEDGPRNGSHNGSQDLLDSPSYAQDGLATNRQSQLEGAAVIPEGIVNIYPHSCVSVQLRAYKRTDVHVYACKRIYMYTCIHV